MLGYAGANPAYPETPIKCLSEKIFFQTGILLSNQPLPSNPIANSGHDFRSQLHHFFYRQRQFGGAEVVRHFGVFHFVQTHLRDYGAAFAVLFRQAFEVLFQASVGWVSASVTQQNASLSDTCPNIPTVLGYAGANPTYTSSSLYK